MLPVLMMLLLAAGTPNRPGETKPLEKGDRFIDFELQNALGESVRLSDLLKDGPVILTWYRGGWCPHCNLALRALQQHLPAFEAEGARLVALTPELPDRSLTTSEKHALSFQVLTDLNLDVARRYGIVFKLDEATHARYESGFGLSAYNGTDSGELPIPATYVIGTDGVIAYAWTNPDYRQRADPEILIQTLKELQ